MPVHKWIWSEYQKGFDIIVREIDTCSESEWETRERDLIKHYKDLGYKLMNLDKGGKGVITKEKRSKSSIQRSIEGHEIPIVALHKDGTFYKEWESSVKAARELNVTHTSVLNVLNGWSKSCQNLMFVRKSEYDPNKKYIYKTNSDKRWVKVYQFDLTGKLIKTFDKITDLNKIKGFSQNGVSSAINNKKLYKDAYWSLEDHINVSEYKSPYKIKVIDTINGEEKLFKSQEEAMPYVGAKSTATISTALKEGNLVYKRYKIEVIN